MEVRSIAELQAPDEDSALTSNQHLAAVFGFELEASVDTKKMTGIWKASPPKQICGGPMDAQHESVLIRPFFDADCD